MGKTPPRRGTNGGQPTVRPAREWPPLWRRLVSEHPFRRGALLVVLALVLEYLVLPQGRRLARPEIKGNW